MHKDLTAVKIFQKVLWATFLLKHVHKPAVNNRPWSRPMHFLQK